MSPLSKGRCKIQCFFFSNRLYQPISECCDLCSKLKLPSSSAVRVPFKALCRPTMGYLLRDVCGRGELCLVSGCCYRPLCSYTTVLAQIKEITKLIPQGNLSPSFQELLDHYYYYFFLSQCSKLNQGVRQQATSPMVFRLYWLIWYLCVRCSPLRLACS